MPSKTFSDHFIIHMYESIRDEVLADAASAFVWSANRHATAPQAQTRDRATRAVLCADRLAGGKARHLLTSSQTRAAPSSMVGAHLGALNDATEADDYPGAG